MRMYSRKCPESDSKEEQCKTEKRDDNTSANEDSSCEIAASLSNTDDLERSFILGYN